MQSLLKDVEWLQGSPTADNLIKGTNHLKKKASFRGGWSAMDIRKRVPEANITGTDSNIIQEKKCPASTREGISIVEAVQWAMQIYWDPAFGSYNSALCSDAMLPDTPNLTGIPCLWGRMGFSGWHMHLGHFLSGN